MSSPHKAKNLSAAADETLRGALNKLQYPNGELRVLEVVNQAARQQLYSFDVELEALSRLSIAAGTAYGCELSLSGVIKSARQFRNWSAEPNRTREEIASVFARAIEIEIEKKAA